MVEYIKSCQTVLLRCTLADFTTNSLTVTDYFYRLYLKSYLTLLSVLLFLDVFSWQCHMSSGRMQSLIVVIECLLELNKRIG